MAARKTWLTRLWVFVLINMVYADILSLMDPDSPLRKIMEGQSEPPADLIVGALVMEIPIVMILLAGLLNTRVNKVVTTIVIILTVIPVLAGGHGGYYVFFATVEVSAMLAILILSWRHEGKGESL